MRWDDVKENCVTAVSEVMTGWRENRRLRRACGGTAAVLGLVLGGWLIVGYWASIPPDAEHDEAEVVLDYYFSDHFERLSQRDQAAYRAALMERYERMDAEQRERAAAVFERRREEDREQARERMIEFGRDFVVREAELYVQVPVEERGEWIEQRLGMWRMLRGDGAEDQGREMEEAQRERSEVTAERQARQMAAFTREVLPRTDARQRAKALVLMNGIQEHYERQ